MKWRKMLANNMISVRFKNCGCPVAEFQLTGHPTFWGFDLPEHAF
jgi:hypothetical protein